MYPGVTTTDGKPMNAQHDYVVRMSKDSLPPAIAFWSLTLYDAKQGFFIPNKENKYSVGENDGMKLDASGGIEVHVAAEQPRGCQRRTGCRSTARTSTSTSSCAFTSPRWRR